MISAYFLFEIPESFGVKKFRECDIQPVAQLFDRRDGGAAIAAADNIIQRRLRDAAERRQFVHSDTALRAELDNAIPDSRT